MISVIVVTYDSATCVGSCLASVQELLPGAELVVVDNGSRDETLRAIRAVAPDAHVIESGENLGFGRACNAGAAAARGSHLLFLNPDAVLAGVDRRELGRLLETRPFGLVAPTLEGERGRRLAENSLMREYFAHTFRTLRPKEWQPPVRLSKQGEAAWVSGALFLVSREEFLGLGGFDPRFFFCYEDRDLSRRYRGMGLPIYTTDAIRGRHAAGSSSAHDELRAAPMAWSLLGWIQYVAIHEDQRTARRAARATLVTLNMLHLVMSSLAITGWGRARRKARQLDALLNQLAERASRDHAGFFPDALRLIRRAT